MPTRTSALETRLVDKILSLEQQLAESRDLGSIALSGAGGTEQQPEPSTEPETQAETTA